MSMYNKVKDTMQIKYTHNETELVETVADVEEGKSFIDTILANGYLITSVSDKALADYLNAKVKS
jgi:hypothetical protein